MACRLFGAKPLSKPMQSTVNWTLTNKLRWSFNQNKTLFIYENASENIVCEMAAIFQGEDELISKSYCIKAKIDAQTAYPNHESSRIYSRFGIEIIEGWMRDKSYVRILFCVTQPFSFNPKHGQSITRSYVNTCSNICTKWQEKNNYSYHYWVVNRCNIMYRMQLVSFHCMFHGNGRLV